MNLPQLRRLMGTSSSDPCLKVLSLGVGVQSSTLLMMAELGEVERPHAAIFADTGWEPQLVYRYLEYLRTQTSIPILVVQWDNLRDVAIKFAQDKTLKGQCPSIPFFTQGEAEKEGMLRRQCTTSYKVEPITAMVRKLLGLRQVRRDQHEHPLAEVWVGISTDEVHRMKPSREWWITRRWPLIEQRMSRTQCREWMLSHGYQGPPKSSCIGCPYHSDAYWQGLKDNFPDEFQEAVEFDTAIRGGFKSSTATFFLHRSRIPLGEVVFKPKEGEDHFGNECEGLCGV